AAVDEGSDRAVSHPTWGGNRFRRICQKGTRSTSTRNGPRERPRLMFAAVHGSGYGESWRLRLPIHCCAHRKVRALASAAGLCRSPAARMQATVLASVSARCARRRSRLPALRALVAAALGHRLIGDPRVEAAIGQSLDGLAAAEEEIRGARI